MSKTYDFAGWATKNDLRCSDGRTIRKNAFAKDDGKKVPLMWMHDHTNPKAVLGHAILKNEAEGVYAFAYFNDTPEAEHAKSSVKHGDVIGLSIWANNLTQNGGDVLHGEIKELSLVLAGANPGARIEFPIIEHSDGSYDEQTYEAYIFCGEQSLSHADTPANDDNSNNEETIADVYETFTDEEKMVTEFLIEQAMQKNGKTNNATVEHADTGSDMGSDSGERTIEDVINDMSDKKRNVLYYLLEQAGNSANKDEDDTLQHYEGDFEDMPMNYNVFDTQDTMQQNTLSHDEMATIIADAKRFGSLKESFLQHAEEYGIEDIEYLFPEAQLLNKTPEFIKRDDTWVSKVMNGVRHSPFSRIKSVFADITEDEARAKGYIKGKLKKEEVFKLLKRTTTPTTVYKKQKLDRDDVADITDFDVISWIKTEMRMMLEEEIARAILVSDGRSDIDPDKIDETHIRPITSDTTLFTITSNPSATGSTVADIAASMPDDIVIAMDEYKGSGNPTAFVRQDVFTRAMLVKDAHGYRMYKNASELATAMMVKEIVPVPNDIMGTDTYAVIVNLGDYTVGADKGGAVSMFDDFDIDYNQMKYLSETRISGTLTKPYSAIVYKKAA